MKIYKKITLFVFVFFIIIIFSFQIASALDFQPQIQIPGTDFARRVTLDDGGGTYYIARYIMAIYQYGISIGAILATVVLMAAGLMWLVSGGNKEKIGQAKNMMYGSIIGLVLLLGSYTILYTINPELVNLRPPDIKELDWLEGDSIEIDTREITDDLFAPIAVKLGIMCGQESLASIVSKTEGRVTYSLSRRFQVDGPENTVYFDCSSYAAFLLKCANINPSLPAFTGDIFSPNNSVKYSNNHLNVGDLLGWPPEGGFGHVYIYIGNGNFADAHGGESGRQPGNAIGIYNIDWVINAASRHNDGNLYYRSGSS